MRNTGDVCAAVGGGTKGGAKEYSFVNPGRLPHGAGQLKAPRFTGRPLLSDKVESKQVASSSHFLHKRAPKRQVESKRSLDLDVSTESSCCPHCKLPIGDFGYYGFDGKGDMIHGECMAQMMLQGLMADENQRSQQDEEQKHLRRKLYGIGWNIERVPRSMSVQHKLKGGITSHGLCCLVLDEDSKTLHLAPTVEPAAAVNLEYLALALQVRCRENREPLFSLDPLDRKTPDSEDFGRDASQVKRFEPEWLAGTSVGEVLFQADFYLKELSMGECDQPVVGMKSCFDLAEEEDVSLSWSARQWFMVRKAEVQLSEDSVLIPRVQMAVEAREQTFSASGLEDAPITRKGHPMVKYAESFSKNFDLIAERRSVIYHLRELAKAAVLAKFIIDAKLQVEQSWYNFIGDMEEACAMEIPQLWNERSRARIRVRDGEIMGANKGIGTNTYGVYGGVAFGLDKFDISRIAPRRAVAVTTPARSTLVSGDALDRQYPILPAPPSGVLQLTKPFSPGISPLFSAQPGLSTTPLSRALPAMRPTVPAMLPSMPLAPPFAAGLQAVSIVPPGGAIFPAIPKGVDLSLNQFSLDIPADVCEGRCVSEPESSEMRASKTEGFWSSLSTGEGTCLNEGDAKLFKHIFNSNLSDRRSEGELFAPPDTSHTYLNRLHSLVAEEEEIRQKRKEYFSSSKFMEEDPGPLFPYSWTSSLEIARPRALKLSNAALQPRDGYTSEAEDILKSASPSFKKRTEDGMVFRIYRVGSLEVRSIQEHNAEELACAVFSLRDRACRKSGSAGGHEKIIKATEYVEKAITDSRDCSVPECQYYTVLETQHGSTIVTEMLRDTVTWNEAPADIDDRNSLAKVVRTASCHGAGASVQDLKNLRAAYQHQRPKGNHFQQSRSYATRAYTTALGGVEAAVKASEQRQKAWDVKEEYSDEEDVDLEKRISDKVSVGGAMTLSPCSQCQQSFLAGYKNTSGLWFCKACWKLMR